MSPDDVRRILAMVAAGDPAAADEIDRMADQLRSLAERLRAGAPVNPNQSTGGMDDRVQMRLVGPYGETKSTHDTHN